MLYFLLQRPIAVFMVLLVALSLSLLAFFTMPVSPLPDKDAPDIAVSVHFPNSPPEEIEQNKTIQWQTQLSAIN